MERKCSPKRRAKSISRMVVQWSPGLSEKGQKEAAMAGRVADIQMQSIGLSYPIAPLKSD